MRRNYFVSIFILLFSLTAFGAKYFDDIRVDTIGVGTMSPSASNILDVVSTSKSSRPCPVMSTAQINGIASPLLGGCVVNSDSAKMNFYDGTKWREFGSGFTGEFEDNSQSGAEVTLDLPTKSVVKLTNNALVSVGGIEAGEIGQIIILQNGSSSNIVIKDGLSSEAPANRIITGTGLDITMKAESSLWLMYSDILNWMVVGGSGVASISDIGDVAFTSLSTNDLLIFDGSYWTNIPNDFASGPASSTDNAVARFDSTTGKLIQNSLVTIADNGLTNIPNYVSTFDVSDVRKLIRGDDSTFRNSLGNWTKYKNTVVSNVPQFDPTGTPDTEVSVIRSDAGTGPNGSPYSMQFSKSTLSGNMQGNGAYLDIDIPKGKRNQWLTFSYEHLTMAPSYTTGDFKIFARDYLTENLITIVGDSNVPALEGKASFKLYSGTSEKIRVYIHVVTTDATDLRGKQFTNFALDSVDAVSIPITQEHVINLAGSGNFTGGSIRVSKVGQSVTISAISVLTHGSLSQVLSATGLIPQWARPSARSDNMYYFNGTERFSVVVFADGTFRTDYNANRVNAGPNSELTISYTVPDTSGTLQGLAVNANPPTLLVSKTGGSTNGSAAIQSWSAPTKNIGFAFNTTTGLATIPEDGDYHFGVDGGWASSQQVAYLPIVNGAQRARYTSQATTPSGAYYNTGYFLLTDLKKGDTIGVSTSTGSALSLTHITFTLEYKPASATMLMAVPDVGMRVDGWLGKGSSATAIQRFKTVAYDKSKGFFTYTASTTNGDSFTIHTKGRYRISVANRTGDPSGSYIMPGISVNANASLATSIYNVSYANGFRDLNSKVLTAGGYGVTSSWSGVLNPGDIVRPHGSTEVSALSFDNSGSYFEIEFLGWVN